jgi:hypothetical protein
MVKLTDIVDDDGAYPAFPPSPLHLVGIKLLEDNFATLQFDPKKQVTSSHSFGMGMRWEPNYEGEIVQVGLVYAIAPGATPRQGDEEVVTGNFPIQARIQVVGSFDVVEVDLTEPSGRGVLYKHAVATLVGYCRAMVLNKIATTGAIIEMPLFFITEEDALRVDASICEALDLEFDFPPTSEEPEAPPEELREFEEIS